jgi:hypothetical protein
MANPFQEAQSQIRNVHSDTSLPLEDVLSNLDTLGDLIEELKDAIACDIEERDAK